MPKIAETLIRLKQSLFEEDEDTGVIHIMHRHHQYLVEYISMLNDSNISNQGKQNITNVFLHVFAMHAKAESDVFYPALARSPILELRHEGLKGSDEHEITFEIIEELRALNYETKWTEEADAKIKVLTGFIKSHIQEEEKIMYPMAKKYIQNSELTKLASEYLKRCKMYLDIEMDSVPSVVSRNDVMTFFY